MSSSTQSVGPAWLGIGAQRSGTTWFTNLLLQHPDVTVPFGKEAHQLYLGFVPGWDSERYRRGFDVSGCPGDFTPYYLRAPWAPASAKLVLRPDAPIIVLLRDPVERYESAIRLAVSRGELDEGPRLGPRIRAVSSDAVWGGFYADQLDAWARVFRRRQIHVIQYESIRGDPSPSVREVWRALRLAPVHLKDVDVPSRTSRGHVDWSLDDVPGLRQSLAAMYEPQIKRLRSWGIDPSLWSSGPTSSAAVDPPGVMARVTRWAQRRLDGQLGSHD